MEDETKKTTENKTGKTHNLVLKRFQDKKITEPYQKAATTEGASLKSLLLLGLVIAAAGISCFYDFPNRSILVMIVMHGLKSFRCCLPITMFIMSLWLFPTRRRVLTEILVIGIYIILRMLG